MIDEKIYTYRMATMKDVPFIAETILEAEKSMTNNLGLANFFEVSEEEMKDYIIQMLEEEIDGCEFSLSGFIVADYEGEAVAAMGGWLEGENEDQMSSALIKSNLIGYILPKEKVLKTREKTEIVRDLQIPREWGTYQLEYSYTRPDHRGHHLVSEIMKRHLAFAKEKYPYVKKAQLHVFENNEVILKIHQKSGYHIAKRFESTNPKVLEYFPYNVELLLEKEL